MIANKTLIPAKVAENAQTTQYTATNCTAVIDKFTVTNISAANAVITVNLIASGGAAGVGNTIISARSIAVGETWSAAGLSGHSIPAGSFISTLAGTASALTIMCSGREVTAN